MTLIKYQSELHAGVIEELNTVIAVLESGCDLQDKKSAENLKYRALSINADVIRIVSNITDLTS